MKTYNSSLQSLIKQNFCLQQSEQVTKETNFIFRNWKYLVKKIMIDAFIFSLWIWGYLSSQYFYMILWTEGVLSTRKLTVRNSRDNDTSELA